MQQTVKKDLTKKKEAQVPVTIDLEETAGQGLENITARDVKDIHGTQKVFDHRAKMCLLAAQGKWSKELENN